MTSTIFEVLPTLSSRDDIVDDPILREAADRAYYASRTGPWTVLPCSVAYCSLSQMITSEEQAELLSQAERIAQQTGRPQDKLLAEQFKTDRELRGQLEYLFDLGNWSPFFKSEPGKKYATMLQMLQYPFSRGSIHIPAQEKVTVDDKPMIDPQYYLGPGEIDKKVMALGQRMTDRICKTEPLAKIVRGRVFPSPETDSNKTDYGDFVSKYTITDWHRRFPFSVIDMKLTLAAVGTCAMGGRGGAQAGVVDERLRVYGVKGLRVVDASIMPMQIGAHIQATVYAIAEKASAMIREDWNSVQK